MIGSLLSLIPSIVGLFSSNSAHDEYSDSLQKIRNNQKLSPSALQAKSMLAENATRGMAGYETMREDIENRLPVTINENRDWLSSGAAVDFLVKSKAQTDQQLRQLNVANAQTKQKNMDTYAGFLGGTMARQENDLLQNQSQLDVAGAYNQVEKSATQNKIMGGVGNMLAGIGDEDISKLVAGLSKGNNWDLDLSTGQDFGIASGQTSTEPAVDTGTAMFPNYVQSPIKLDNSDKSQLARLNLLDPDNPTVGANGYAGQGSYNENLMTMLIQLMANRNSKPYGTF